MPFPLIFRGLGHMKNVLLALHCLKILKGNHFIMHLDKKWTLSIFTQNIKTENVSESSLNSQITLSISLSFSHKQ